MGTHFCPPKNTPRKLRVLKVLKNGGQVVFAANPATGKKGVSCCCLFALNTHALWIYFLPHLPP